MVVGSSYREPFELPSVVFFAFLSRGTVFYFLSGCHVEVDVGCHSAGFEGESSDTSLL